MIVIINYFVFSADSFAESNNLYQVNSVHSHETQFQVQFLICMYTVFKGNKIVSGAIGWNLAIRGTASLFI